MQFLLSARSRSLPTNPRAVATNRQRMSRIDRAIITQRLQDRFDKTVAGVARQAFAVRAEVRQSAAAVPDRHGRAGGNLFGAGQHRDGFKIAQGGGQLAVAAGLLHRKEFHAPGAELFDHLGQVLLVADVAWAGGIPEVHQTDIAGAGEVVGQAQRVTGKYRSVFAERPQVAALKPVVCGPQHAGTHDGEQAGKQCGAVGRTHGFDSSKAG